MPGGDRTGPMGMGSKTGRGAGYCTGYARPRCANFLSGRSMGVGRGRGFRRMFNLIGLMRRKRSGIR
jgi:hypothetical protein